MINIGNKAIDTLYVGGRLVQQAWLGGKKIYPAEGQIPERIKESMVLWYDTVRQGCTNESMSANPMLTDLSGNGHDAECRNFAWTEQSGISTADYPGALVSDGVDDMAIATKPVLTDYTLIVKRQIPATRSSYGVVATTRNQPGGTKMSFSFEAIQPDNNDTCVLMNYQLSGQTVDLDIANPVSWMTPKSYNGQNIARGSILTDSDKLYLFCGGLLVTYAEFLQVALYSFILFNRTLTQDEIGWVKTNLIGG